MIRGEVSADHSACEVTALLEDCEVKEHVEE